MTLNQQNTKRQGNVGLGQAIAYFTKEGYSVSVPLTESQRYDLIVDDGDTLHRVEVKTTRHKPKGTYVVLLSTQGGNQSWSTSKKKFSSKDADYIFVVTDEGVRYLIPASVADGKANLYLGLKCQQYIV